MNEKRYVSVICEYNPFHFGHLYQLEQLKKDFDGVVCIMSGNIVQRGSVAVADKYIRAEAALKSGASLVVELPVPWCCASARDFASAGVHIASNIGTPYLAFGAEDDMQLLCEVDSLASNSEFAEALKTLVESRKNISYPRAFRMLVAEHLGAKYALAAEKPNNILALEYISAVKGKNIQPLAVKRNMEFLPSSHIRALSDGAEMLKMLPEQSRAVFSAAMNMDFPRESQRLDSFFIGELRRMAACGNIPSEIYGTPEDLAQRLVSESMRVSTTAELIANCIDKIYTSARVRRALVATVIGITPRQVQSMPPYTCVLAADGVGREILRDAKMKSNIEIITKPAHALFASDEVRRAYTFAKSAEDIILLSAPCPEPASAGKTPFIR